MDLVITEALNSSDRCTSLLDVYGTLVTVILTYFSVILFCFSRNVTTTTKKFDDNGLVLKMAWNHSQN